MITPQEIKQKSLSWYPLFLSSCIRNETFFPKEIRFGKISSRDVTKNFEKVSGEVAALKRFSKENSGDGYSIEFTEIQNRSIGRNQFPQRIYFQDQSDYLSYIGKQKEFTAFKKTSERIIIVYPQLKKWVSENPLLIIRNLSVWDDVFKVLDYFILNPKPGLYIRELPINIHTKFIEQNKNVIRQLLDILISSNVAHDESQFEKRFHLRYSEPLIRLRLLDQSICETIFSGVTDMCITQSEFINLQPVCKRIFITENIMNFLTLPTMNKTIAIWGQGFGVEVFKNVGWISTKEIIYWGDIDPHGFQILSQLRSYYSNVISFLMDEETFFLFDEDERANSSDSPVLKLNHLTVEENILFKKLKLMGKKNRIEQEKIPQDYTLRKLKEILLH